MCHLFWGIRRSWSSSKPSPTAFATPSPNRSFSSQGVHDVWGASQQGGVFGLQRLMGYASFASLRGWLWGRPENCGIADDGCYNTSPVTSAG